MKKIWLAAIVAGVAVIFAAVATATLSLVPRFNLRLVEGMICPPDQTLDYQESAPYTITDAQGTRRVANVSIDCVAPDGTRVGGKEGATIGSLMGVYFLLCFVPFLGVGIWAVRRWFPGTTPPTSPAKKV